MLTVAGVEGDDEGDVLGLHKAGEAQGILAAVIDHGAHREGQRMVGKGFEEAIQAGRPHGKVGGMGRLDQHLQGECMLVSDDAVLEGAMAEKVRARYAS
jgi:hypothetical protein